MGIKGLLPLLKPITKDIHIEQFAGKRVAVDGHCWLHRGTFGCSYELAMNIDTTSYVRYFMELVRMMLYFKVIPVIVFDGQPLPMKQVTNAKRSLDRQESLSLGKIYQSSGRIEEATKAFQKSISITQEIIYKVIEALRAEKVEHVVAPFEADAQLTYMIRKGQVDAVLSEDSDLLTFGCDRVIYKMSRTGEAQLIEYKDIFTSSQLRMTQFTPEMFRYMCITAGCDYLPSLGAATNSLTKAHKILEQHSTLKELFKYFQMFGTKSYIEPYLFKFLKADAAFLYQYVFDMDTRTYTYLNPIPPSMDREHVSLLGDDPRNRFIYLLRANRPIIDPRANQKENVNPKSNSTAARNSSSESYSSDDDSDSEFQELKFNTDMLGQVSDLLARVEPKMNDSVPYITQDPSIFGEDNKTHIILSGEPTNANKIKDVFDFDVPQGKKLLGLIKKHVNKPGLSKARPAIPKSKSIIQKKNTTQLSLEKQTNNTSTSLPPIINHTHEEIFAYLKRYEELNNPIHLHDEYRPRKRVNTSSRSPSINVHNNQANVSDVLRSYHPNNTRYPLGSITNNLYIPENNQNNARKRNRAMMNE